MKNQKKNFNIDERDIGDIVWNGLPVEKIGDNKFENDEKRYNISDFLQNVLTNTSNLLLKTLNEKR